MHDLLRHGGSVIVFQAKGSGYLIIWDERRAIPAVNLMEVALETKDLLLRYKIDG